jgi:hypothetical protein
MPRANTIITNFTAGELSPRLFSRVDTAKYRNGAATMENFVIMPHGGAKKRGGSVFVAPAHTAANSSLLVPFEYNVEQAYILEFADNKIRIYRNRGILTYSNKTITAITKANPAVVTSNGHGFANGEVILIQSVGGMVELNNRQFTVANQTANTFELSGINSTSFTTYTSGGTAAVVLEVTSPYDITEVDDLSFAQSADTLYIAHPDYALRKLTRSGATVWSLDTVAIEGGPFRSINADTDLKLTIAATGSATITNATQANPVVITTSAAHGFSDGCTVTITAVTGMTQLNNNKYVVKNPTSTTFELYTVTETKVDGSGYSAYTANGTATRSTSYFSTLSPGTTVTLTATAAVFNSNHVGALFRVWEPGKFTGVATPVATKSVAENDTYTTDAKVYGVKNLTVATEWSAEWQYPTHERGVVRVQDTGGTRYFDSVYLHDSSAILEITAYSSSTSVTAEVVGSRHVPRSVIDFGTSLWEEGAWSDDQGYPHRIVFHEQRLWAAATDSDTRTVWGSRAGVFEDFSDGADDDDAIVYALASDKVDAIQWMAPSKILGIGTASGEFIAAASSQNEALTPTNARIAKQTPYGSSTARPVTVSNAIIFAQRNGVTSNGARKVREFAYSLENDSYTSSDLTIISEHITGSGGVEELAYQLEPDSVIWCRRSDGRLAACTYEREQEVVGWHRHTLGGVGDSSDGIAVIERIAVIPGTDGDEIWMLVKRYIDGGTVRYIEYLSAGLMDAWAKEDSIFLDSSATYDSAATTTVSGLYHLRGETVQVLADGASHDDVTVSATGGITLTRSASVVQIGYGYTAELETLDIEAGAAAGTAQSRAKRIANAWIRFYRTLGADAGSSSTNTKAILFRDANDPLGASAPLFSGYKEVPMKGGWDREASVYIKSADPLPCTVLGVVVEISTSG